MNIRMFYSTNLSHSNRFRFNGINTANETFQLKYWEIKHCYGVCVNSYCCESEKTVNNKKNRLVWMFVGVEISMTDGWILRLFWTEGVTMYKNEFNFNFMATLFTVFYLLFGFEIHFQWRRIDSNFFIFFSQNTHSNNTNIRFLDMSS